MGTSNDQFDYLVILHVHSSLSYILIVLIWQDPQDNVCDTNSIRIITVLVGSVIYNSQTVDIETMELPDSQPAIDVAATEQVDTADVMIPHVELGTTD